MSRSVMKLGCGIVLNLFLLLPLASQAHAGVVAVAVAANFEAAAKEIAKAFEVKTGDTVTFSAGPSGQLYTQITQGALFDIFLSADAVRPKTAEEEGWAVPGSRFTYAVGKLVLWSAEAGIVDARGEVLRLGAFAHLAIANPDAAPYGVAAMETLKALGLDRTVGSKIVKGTSITQAYQFIASGNAELGFVALSQLVDRKNGSSWIVPERLYSPILQDAVLLKTGERNESAKAFFTFMKSPQAVRIIRRYGYGVQPGA